LQEGLVKKFVFSSDNEKLAAEIISHYPMRKAALLPLLDLAQRQLGWISNEAMEYLAELLRVPLVHVREVVSFYTMFRTQQVGKYLIQICRTTPCWLCGSDMIKRKITKLLGIEVGETTSDGMFTLQEVECLGACCDAPVVQINDEYYERLTEERIASIIKHLSAAA
jgi:NADH-quinone oxidoreductase subunit E